VSDRRTDSRTDAIAVASTALAMRALRRAVKRRRSNEKPAVFDHVNLKNMYVMLNATRYPAVDYNLSFANQQYSRAYGDASMFGVRNFGMDELITRSNISPIDYKSLYPLFALMSVSRAKN